MTSHENLGNYVGQPSLREPLQRYSCELDGRHVDPLLLSPLPTSYVETQYADWSEALDNSIDPANHIAQWAKRMISLVPAGIDMAKDVDDGGGTMSQAKPSMFTQWVELESGIYTRFAEARTATHGSQNALRTPTMNGIVLEGTTNPESIDPRDAISLTIFEFAREEDARYPWKETGPGRVFDLAQYDTKPYFAGPLYGGHPNQITDRASFDEAIEIAVATLQLTFDSYQSDK